MLITAAISLTAAAAVNFIYFKAKHDKLLFPIVSAVVFSVIISILLYPKTDIIAYIKYFSVLSFLHLCSTNDIIRHRSDDIFPLLMIAAALVLPQNLAASLVSFAVIAVIFIIIIVSGKDTIGGGDIKMICALTFFFGLTTTVTAVIIACITGIIFAAASKYIAKLPDFGKRFAFLPFVEVGYVIALLVKLY